MGATLATAQALALAANSRVRVVETINDSLDVDLYRLTANAGDVLSVAMSRVQFGNSYVRLFDAAGVQVAADGFSGPQSAPLVHYHVAASGTYYVGASGWSNATYDPTLPGSGTHGGTGGYTLEVQRAEGASTSLSAIVGVAASGTPAQSALASANVGQSITLTGAGLSATDAVVFSTRDSAGTQGTQTVTPASVAGDGTSLTVAVPTNATSGMVRLAREQAGLFLQVVPTLADADISTTYHGGTLALRGTGFSEGDSRVHFGAQSFADSGPVSGVDVFGSQQENDRLNVTVPNAVPFGPIAVSTLGGTSAALVRSFTGIVGVAGSGTPADSGQASANPGQAIVLQGVGLDLTSDVVFLVSDGSGNVAERIVRGTAVNAAGTQLTVLVPLDALTAPIAVVGDQNNTQALLQVVPVITRADMTSVASNGTSAQVQLRGAGFVEDRGSEYTFGATLVRDDSFSAGPDVHAAFVHANDAVNLTLPLAGDYDGAVTVKTAGGTSAPFSVGFTGLEATALSGTPADAQQPRPTRGRR